MSESNFRRLTDRKQDKTCMYTTGITIGENDEVPVEAEVVCNSEEAYARNITVAEDYSDNNQIIYRKGDDVTKIKGVEDRVMDSYISDRTECEFDGKDE